MSKQSDYERLKSDWVRANPNATPAQYQAAMKAIAKRLGI